MRRIILVTVGCLVWVFASISDARAQETIPRFKPSECPITVPDDVSIECGTLIVPEDYNNLDGRVVRLPVIVIREQGAPPSSQALLFTEGGPGYSSLRSVWWLANTKFLHGRDIVILEQRGNIHADPSLTCDVSVWWEEYEGETPCLDSLRQKGIDLDNYTTTSLAADIQALMQTLEYKAWNLYGTSYSTRLMQLVMLQYPHKIRSVVLQSISPLTDTRLLHDPDHASRALKVMFDDCAANADCASAYPDLENQLYKLVRQLNAEPVDLKIKLSETDEDFTYQVDGAKLIDWMVGSAYYKPAFPPYATAYLPLLIDQLSRGSWDMLYPWAMDDLSRYSDPSFAWGLYLAVNCQEEAPVVSPVMMAAQAATHPELDGYLRHGNEVAICEAWDLYPGSPLAAAPVESDVPTLALGGTYDPITPPEWSQTALEGLSNATFIEFPSAGHSVLTDKACAEDIISAFLDNPDRVPDVSCLVNAPETRFVLPQQVIIAPDAYEIHYGEIGHSQFEQNLFLGSLFTLAITAGILMVAGFIRLARRSGWNSMDRLARIAPTLVGVLGLISWGWAFALRSVLRKTASVEPHVLRFGLPVDTWWLFSTALLIGLLTIALIALTLLAWRRGCWSIGERIIFTASVLAACLFSGMLASWGFLTALFV